MFAARCRNNPFSTYLPSKALKEGEMHESYFPIKIELQPTEGAGIPSNPIRIISSPENIPVGVPFIVIKTMVVCFAGYLER